MIDLHDDGSIDIDFPAPTGKVTIRPPKFGAYRRLQNEREREIGHMNEKIAGLPKLDPIPDDKAIDATLSAEAREEKLAENKAERERLAPMYRSRVIQVQDFSAEALEAIWRLILLGSSGEKGDFAALATTEGGAQIPDDVDEWPIELLVDSGDLSVGPDGSVVRTNPTILDTVLRHWGKARYRSGPTAPLPTS